VRCINATTSNFWLLQYWTTNLLSSQGPTPPTKCVLDNHPLVFFIFLLWFFFFNVGVRTRLLAPRLISWSLELATI
jgi:hypothetical protein